MSDNYPPFVVRRPDGFQGVEIGVSDQLTPDETRSLAMQLLILAHEAEFGTRQFDVPGWIVWERAGDGGRPHIRAIDLSEKRADRHVEYLKAGAKLTGNPEPDLLVEETRLDHLYAQNLMEALRKRKMK